MEKGSDLSPDQKDRLHKFAHDLRNRLVGLHQALEHVAKGDGSDTAEILDYGEQQFFKALRQVESLLDDLHVERGEQRSEALPVALAEVIEQAAMDLEHRFIGKQQQLDLKLDGTIQVRGDNHLITTSVAALLSNASKFSPMEAPVEVLLTRQGDHAELCVIDQGVGLTEDDLENIFVRYAWLNSRSTNGEAQGRSTLSRAQKWAQGMGGDLLVASEGTGKGCAFTLRLPLA